MDQQERSSRQLPATVIPAAVHALLAGFVLWALRRAQHPASRAALGQFAAIFAAQTVAPLTRNERLIEWTYRGPLARLEFAPVAGLMVGSAAARRWPVAAGLALSTLLVGPLGRRPQAKGAGQILFLASLLGYGLWPRNSNTGRSGSSVPTGADSDRLRGSGKKTS